MRIQTVWYVQLHNVVHWDQNREKANNTEALLNGTTSANSFFRQRAIWFLQDQTVWPHLLRARVGWLQTDFWFSYLWILAKCVEHTPQCAKDSRKSCTFAISQTMHWWWHVLKVPSPYGSPPLTFRFRVQNSLISSSYSHQYKKNGQIEHLMSKPHNQRSVNRQVAANPQVPASALQGYRPSVHIYSRQLLSNLEFQSLGCRQQQVVFRERATFIVRLYSQST